ncbi:putative dehydrin [Dioscorea sansibarensis]
MDAYGNPIKHTDQYGNPVPPRYTDVGGDTGYGVGTAGYDTTTTAPHQAQHAKEPHSGGVTGMLHRSGSSSSSSSEDDGMGGRRKKKGLKEKIKEKMPGGHKTGTTTTDEYGTGVQVHQQQPHAQTQTHEKKGMMEKIKEKLPGHY